MTAQSNAFDWRSMSGKAKDNQIQCFNCTGSGHRSHECTAPMCMRCEQTWASIKAPGYHHNTACPHKGRDVGIPPIKCTNCRIMAIIVEIVKSLFVARVGLLGAPPNILDIIIVINVHLRTRIHREY